MTEPLNEALNASTTEPLVEPTKEDTLPFKMERAFARSDYKNGELTIKFTDAGHLADAWEFARKHGKEAAFERAIMRLIGVALGAAVPQTECTWPDGTVFKAQPGREISLTIRPDGYDDPGFSWHEKMGQDTRLVGGLLWHHRSGEWSIHT